jgi:hypothetical protein
MTAAGKAQRETHTRELGDETAERLYVLSASSQCQCRQSTPELRVNRCVHTGPIATARTRSTLWSTTIRPTIAD